MRFAVQSGLIDYNPAQEIAGAVATAKRQHRAALELNRIPELLHCIDHYSGRPLTRLAVKLTLFVFIRSSELRFVRWTEVDFETAMWTIPGERKLLEGVKHSQRGSKMKTPHLVPLSRQALTILEKIKSMSGNRELIFVGDHDCSGLLKFYLKFLAIKISKHVQTEIKLFNLPTSSAISELWNKSNIGLKFLSL